ncbi:hypothetical protein LSCM1_05691 [Leishmania martiniquensis]|uniref:Uncharacterized protein n=1 Tax=Leishmania martiniquensis TaxID=1580590 RepID=A0A836GXJ5_9TRYP|nr:hypothetical protein LSCM1_05691 [Leishmania martiniquensis]
MPNKCEGDSPADVAGTTSTTDAINVDIRIQQIGIVGCSASGKSTVAHHIACSLGSPLHPISTDSFFLDDTYRRLRTYEDFRCIDYDAVARWMSILAHAVPTVVVSLRDEDAACASAPATKLSGGAASPSQRDWEELVHEAWWAQIVLHLPESSKHRRVAPEGTWSTKAPRTAMGAAAAPAQPSSAHVEADPAGSHRSDWSSGDDGDASLGAQEAEEDGRRRRSVAASTQRKERCGQTGSLPPSLHSGTDAPAPHAVVPFACHVTIYVVWEGLTLLCNRLVNSYIDYAIDVQCDAETACLRRFFRTPRHHLAVHLVFDTAWDDQHGPTDEAQLRQQRVRAAAVAGVVRQVYRRRIEQMWFVRSREQQRTDLMTALEQEMQLDGWESLAHLASSTTTSSPACVAARDALHLFSPLCFEPPRPSCMRQRAHADAAKALCDGVRGAHLQGGGVGAEATPEKAESDVSAHCWSADGLPTRAFQSFWESECGDGLTRMWSSPTTAAGAAALQWVSLAHCDEEAVGVHAGLQADEEKRHAGGGPRAMSPSQPTLSANEAGAAYVNRMLAQRGRLALLQSSSCRERAAAPSSSEACSTGAKGAFAVELGLEPQLAEDDGDSCMAASAATISSVLAPFYYEFRYWFYFEVLYYHRVCRPLQLHRLQWRSMVGDRDAEPTSREGRSGEGGGCGDPSAPRAVPRPWWTIWNGRDVRGESSDELLTQVAYVSAAIRAIR